MKTKKKEKSRRENFGLFGLIGGAIQVFQVRHKADGKIYAMKVLSKEHIRKKNEVHFPIPAMSASYVYRMLQLEKKGSSRLRVYPSHQRKIKARDRIELNHLFRGTYFLRKNYR